MVMELSRYERKQLVELETWKNEKPGFISQKIGDLPYRLEWLIEGALPEMLLNKALEMVNFSARWTVDEKNILKTSGCSSLVEVGQLPLERCDEMAINCQRWATGLGAAEGAATGVTGLSGLAADIPAILTLAIRTIYQIGYCYGCDANDVHIQQLAFTILGIAVAENANERQQAMQTLRDITRETLTDERVIGLPLVSEKTRSLITFKQVGRQIGANLLKRKALQTIPALGAIAGSSINAWYMREVAIASRRVFQEIWFARHDKSPDLNIIDA